MKMLNVLIAGLLAMSFSAISAASGDATPLKEVVTGARAGLIGACEALEKAERDHKNLMADRKVSDAQKAESAAAIANGRRELGTSCRCLSGCATPVARPAPAKAVAVAEASTNADVVRALAHANIDARCPSGSWHIFEKDGVPVAKHCKGLADEIHQFVTPAVTVAPAIIHTTAPAAAPVAMASAQASVQAEVFVPSAPGHDGTCRWHNPKTGAVHSARGRTRAECLAALRQIARQAQFESFRPGFPAPPQARAPQRGAPHYGVVPPM
jgi:hypothetical protein